MLEYREINLSMLPQLSRLFAETFNAAPWKENWSQETCLLYTSDAPTT